MAATAPQPASTALRLVREVVRFQLQPQRDLHPSWLPADWPARHRRPQRWGEGAQAALAHWLSQGELADARPDAERYDFDAPLRRLALLDGPALRRLAAWCGFAVHRPLLRQRGGVPRRAAAR